jgi:hypothetical protein
MRVLSYTMHKDNWGWLVACTETIQAHPMQPPRDWLVGRTVESGSPYAISSSQTRLFTTLFFRRPHQIYNWMKYPLSVKSFISLFSRLTSVIKYNDVIVKYHLSDETIWLTMSVSFRFICFGNGLALCHTDVTASFSSLINLMSCQQKIWCVMIINTMKLPLWIA